MAAIVHSTNDARAQSLGVASIRSVQAEVHSVVGICLEFILLPPASPEAWNTFWDNLPSEKVRVLTNQPKPAVAPTSLSF